MSATTIEASGELTAAQVRAFANQLITDEYVILPVRHHSPACAWQVRHAIERYAPSLVLVEGPRSFTDLVPLLTHPNARMPLAVYTYAVLGNGKGETERYAAYYPFCDYSPELVAIREATARGVPVRFIDLEYPEQIAHEETDERAGQPPRDGVSLLDEQALGHSERLRRLAEQIGCRDVEDLWERLFEVDVNDVDLVEHVARVAAYCLLARRDHTPAQLDAEGTTAREAEMTWHLAQALAERPSGAGPVLVVVGGFHAVALPELLADPPRRPTTRITPTEQGTALIRYGFDRLDRLNGYAAGMTSPAWHQRLWEAYGEHTSAVEARRAACLEVLLDVADALRTTTSMPVPTPSVAAAYEQALRMAELRGHGAPLRSDLVEAVTSCFVKGDADLEGVRVRDETLRVLRGDRFGVLPPGAGTPPLVRDTMARLRAARLQIDDPERRSTKLDLYRKPAHRATSRILHGLGLLGVPFAVRQGGPDFIRGTGLARLQEHWEYGWSPLTEGSLVEASVWGPTLPEAVAARFEVVCRELQEGPDRRDAKAAVSLLAHACVLGLHTAADEITAVVRDAIHSDSRFDSVAEATCHLALLWEGREPLEARRLTALPGLLRSAYERAIYLGREMRDRESDPDVTVAALAMLRELLQGAGGADLDADLYWAMVDHLRVHHDAALIRGAATGLGYSAGRLDERELGQAVAGHLSGTVSPEEAVDFTRGVLATAREVAWQDSGLVPALDEHLATWDEKTFLTYLPQLRLAFSVLTPAETDRVAALVAARHGLVELGPLVRRDVDEQTMARHLALSQEVMAVLRRDGLEAWVTA